MAVPQVLSTYLVFNFESGLSLAWNSPTKLGWLASKSQGSVRFSPSDTWVKKHTARLHSTFILHESEGSDSGPMLQGKPFTDGAVIPPPRYSFIEFPNAVVSECQMTLIQTVR